ncbi:MAG: 5-(carboxyamino)imidazole ribonucleotide synthase [Phycisphaerales bacterium]
MLIGVVGGGQLGRMLGLAGIPLGHRFRFLDPDPACPAAAVGEVVAARFDDVDAIAGFARGLDAATFEFENVPAAALEALAARVRVAPGVRSLAVAQDRIAEKDFFRACRIPVQAYEAVSSEHELAAACGRVGFPGVLKTRRLGYDGKGQAVVRTPRDVPAAWQAVGGAPCIYEAFVEFQHEVSVIAVRGGDGQTVVYPLNQNVHRAGILRTTLAPAPAADAGMQAAAEAFVQTAMDALGHVGTLTIEFFATREGLVANEMAPRVHNSGHWTIEGAVTSQFENHVRAVAGEPLGSAAARGPSAMVNLIGRLPARDAVLAVPGAKLHDYGKAPRRGRKVGHASVCAPDAAVRDAQVRVLAALAEESADG